MTAAVQPDQRTPGQRLFARLSGLWRRRWVKGVFLGVTVLAAIFVAATGYLVLHVQPILKARLVDTLRRRFNSPVALDELDVSLVRGIEVRGRRLRIQYLAGPGEPDPRPAGIEASPMLSVAKFEFRTSFRELTGLRTRIGFLSIEGLELHIPPHAASADQRAGVKAQPLVSMLIDRIRCRKVTLFIETDKPGRGPGEIEIPSVDLVDVGRDRPLEYDAIVVNPKPKATIHVVGHLGPWAGAAPRETPLDGSYDFSDMDLASIRGIGGALVSQGTFNGELGQVTVDGTASTRNFSLDVSNHPMPLTARFHAQVDGTSGDTKLTPVQARLGQSNFTVTGSIERLQPAGEGVEHQGHDIALQVTMPHGRIEDLLELGMKTSPPVMHGAVTMQTRLHIPPGPERVPAKMQLAGTLHLQAVVFTDRKLQARIDDMSLRGQGHPQQAHDANATPQVNSQMSIDFTLGRGLLTANKITYDAPGLDANLDGAYSLDGANFDFRGRVRTRAAPSQMVTGWKSWLLKGVDPFVKKGDFGLVVPIEISGASNDVKLGIPMHGVDDTAQQIASQMKSRPKVTIPLPPQ